MNFREIIRFSFGLVFIAGLAQCTQEKTPETVSETVPVLGPYL